MLVDFVSKHVESAPEERQPPRQATRTRPVPRSSPPSAALSPGSQGQARQKPGRQAARSPVAWARSRSPHVQAPH